MYIVNPTFLRLQLQEHGYLLGEATRSLTVVLKGARERQKEGEPKSVLYFLLPARRKSEKRKPPLWSRTETEGAEERRRAETTSPSPLDMSVLIPPTKICIN